MVNENLPKYAQLKVLINYVNFRKTVILVIKADIIFLVKQDYFANLLHEHKTKLYFIRLLLIDNNRLKTFGIIYPPPRPHPNTLLQINFVQY